MRYFALLVVLALGALAGKGCRQSNTKPESPTSIVDGADEKDGASQKVVRNDEPLLLLDDEPLLLLDNGPGGGVPAGAMADNSRCFVCHMNYVQEDIAVFHARANIGCADCHGDSDAHIADESWSWGENGTAPDVMYRRAEVNNSCMKCHPREEIDDEQHKALFAGTAKEKHCTDCHGKHRLARRKCKWK